MLSGIRVRIRKLRRNRTLDRRAVFWLFGLLVTVATSSASFLWLDRPIATFVHDHFRYQHRTVVDELSHFPNPLLLLAVILAVILGARMILGWPLSRDQANAFVCSLGVIVTEVVKDALKFIFGRTWPETWVHDNPSFIRDGVYGFHFFQGGSAYQSFPSGHMAGICTVIAVLWLRYPRFRMLYLVAGLLIGAGLVGANYHFLSDVIAGAFVGLSIGILATLAWDRCAARELVAHFDRKEMISR